MTGVVTRTGDRTFIGQIARFATAHQSGSSTLETEVRKFVYFIAALSITSACIFLLIGMLKGTDFITVFVNRYVSLFAKFKSGLTSSNYIS